MALENLKQNLETERNLIQQIIALSSDEEKNSKTGLKKINSLILQIKLLNNSIPELLRAVSPYRELKKGKGKAEKLVNLKYMGRDEKEISATVNKKDEKKYLKEAGINRDILRRLKKGFENKGKKKEFAEFKRAGAYAKLSNKFFFDYSSKLLKNGHFRNLNRNLRKANLPYLVTTYLSVSFFSTMISFIAGIILFAGLIFIRINLNFPFVQTAEFDIFRMLKNFAVFIILIPSITFISFIFYPSAEKRNISGRIDQELPFVTIHMSAIAGSGIEPSQIFKIIALGEEYPYSKREFKKIINQVNVYGYDLVTALKNTARETSSKKLSELLSGIASTISGGSEMTTFLDKRAETLLFEYKLEREKYTKTAETFMDIYISIMIAAPMIMMLLLILISISGISIGISLQALTLIIISIVALINIIFLMFLHIKQPGY